jgi:uncharacterized membrane protein YeaQ/YmgE (transglycosylase-associated protein family)
MNKSGYPRRTHMAAVSMILADVVTIKIGNNIWSFNLNLIVYLIVAAVIGLVAESILGWRTPLGIIGAIVAALVGVWLMTQVIIITGIPDYNIPTTPAVPLVRALIGAIVLVALWHLIFGSLFGRRRATN